MQAYRPYLLVIGLLAATSLALTFATKIAGLAPPGILLEMPSEVGNWRGRDVWFCQNEACLRSFTDDQAGGRTVCPSCGGTLAPTWSLAETRLLSPDTFLMRKDYINPEGDRLSVSVVVTGAEPGNIHRAQGCIVGQGFAILAQRPMVVDLPGRRPLHAQYIEMTRPQRPAGSGLSTPSYFLVHWFTDGKRETSSTAERVFLTVLDRVGRGRAGRWSYISIMSSTRLGSTRQENLLRQFIREFYPQILPKDEVQR